MSNGFFRYFQYFFKAQFWVLKAAKKNPPLLRAVNSQKSIVNSR